MLSALLNDGPALILCPSTLTFQWQVELKDRLGIPSAVWSSNKKVWIDPNGHTIKTRGAEVIARCPFRIAIVSTGPITQPSEERRLLLLRKYGTNSATRRPSIRIKTAGNFVHACWRGRMSWKSLPNPGRWPSG